MLLQTVGMALDAARKSKTTHYCRLVSRQNKGANQYVVRPYVFLQVIGVALVGCFLNYGVHRPS